MLSKRTEAARIALFVLDQLFLAGVFPGVLMIALTPFSGALPA